MPDFDNATHLLDLAKDKSDGGREALVNAVSDMMADGADALGERERDLVFLILNQIVLDTERRVRAAISSRIAELPDAPRNLIKLLANDDIVVAFPVLSQSTVLQDTDLVEIVRNRAVEHQLAVSVREDLSEDVTDALVEKGDQSVIVNLLNNPSAKISGSTMQYLVDESKRVNSYREPILRREDLDPETAKQMYAWVSDALRRHISASFPIDQKVLDKVVADVMAEDSTTAGDASDRLAADLGEEKEITPEFLIDTLKVGHIHLFVSLFRELTGLQKTLITKLILEPTGEGLAIASKAMGFDLAQYEEIFELCGKARKSANGKAEAEAATRLFVDVRQPAAQQVVYNWCRGTNYLAALRNVAR